MQGGPRPTSDAWVSNDLPEREQHARIPNAGGRRMACASGNARDLHSFARDWVSVHVTVCATLAHAENKHAGIP